jgi:hypothetical protein
MKIALQDLQLEKISVIYPGTRRYKITDRIEAVPFEEIIQGKNRLLLYK